MAWSGWNKLLWPVGTVLKHKFIVATLFVAALYAAFELTPSSYALALRAIGVTDDGLVAGSTQPIRSDEWAVWTPYMQIAVNNGFARIDAQSPYHEDLRNFNALPLADWGLLFKPQLLAFHLFSPAAAYSLMFAILFAACLVGWYLLALELRFSRGIAVIFSVSIFALPFVQLWWTTIGPLIAFLPWLSLSCLVPMPAYLRLPAVGWMTAVFLLSHLYVPFQATLIFAGALIILAFRPDTLRMSRLVPILLGGALGAGLVLLYLWEPITIMAETIYPGHRTSIRGGLLPKSFLLAYLFPHFISAKWSAFYWNDCEVGTGGSYALLFSLVFLNFGRLREVAFAQTPDDRATRRILLPLSAGLVMIVAWWLLPLPSSLGTPLLWNAIDLQRLAFAAGLLAHAVAFVLLLRVGAIASVARVAIAVSLIVAAAIASKFELFATLWPLAAIKYDLLVLPLLLAAYWVRRSDFNWGPLLLLCGAVANAVVFVPYNPLQKAGPIFAKHDTPALRLLATEQAAHPENWLVDPRLPGALQVGLGFRAIQHVLIAPQLSFFREKFPDLPPEQFNAIFNRYAHIRLDPAITTPYVPQNDVVLVPVAPFQ